MARARKTIMVDDDTKNKILSIKESMNFGSELQVIEFLLRLNDSFDVVELAAFMSMREKMFESFKRESKKRS